DDGGRRARRDRLRGAGLTEEQQGTDGAEHRQPGHEDSPASAAAGSDDRERDEPAPSGAGTVLGLDHGGLSSRRERRPAAARAPYPADAATRTYLLVTAPNLMEGRTARPGAEAPLSPSPSAPAR